MKDLVEKASKQEEIEWLQALAKSVQGKDLYLADLFTEKLVNWAAEAIRNDFPPNIFESMETAWSEEAEVRVSLKASEANLLANARESKEKDDRINFLESLIGEMDVRILDLTRQEQAKYEEANDLFNEKEALAVEIIRLKARLFDLIDRNH